MKNNILIGDLLLTTHFAHSKTAITSSGGIVTGDGGTATYSIGQLVYTTNSYNSGSIAQGVQQGLVGLQIQEKINSNLKRIKEVKTENININWLTFGGGIGYDSYDLFDVNREFDKQIFEKEDMTPSFSLAVSKDTNQSLFNSKKNNLYLLNCDTII